MNELQRTNNQAPVNHQVNAVPTSSISILDTNKLDVMIRAAEFMSKAVVTVPEHLRGNTSDCLAIVMQAEQWGMNPFTVAQKTHLVSGTLGYEAQLVNAVISSSRAIVGRFHYRFSDGWERLVGKVGYEKQQRTNFKTKAKWEVTVATKKWLPEDEAGLWVECGAVVAGESEITWGPKLYLASILVRNSELWVTKPQQQIAYASLKDWSRLYTPAVMQGVYDREELAQPSFEDIRDITPEIKQVKQLNNEPSIDSLMGGDTVETESEPGLDALVNGEVEVMQNNDTPSVFETTRDLITDISDIQECVNYRRDIETMKNNQTITANEFSILKKMIKTVHNTFSVQG
ncbi:recombinase RecT [Photobacterium frigidiphilum]|uniref:RecT family recombinase n=1 Tax=Photobacterium frigidiphilum TaxID=264736 RepID=UPI003D0D08E9